MATDTIMGSITFIKHDKNYATIEYLANGKKKSVNGNISEREQLKLKAEKIIKKIHHFHVGDEVSFILTTSSRGDKMIADCIEFKYNNALDSLLNKSKIENRFVGYLKKVEDGYFVKETGSYIFLPLVLSQWEKPPDENKLNEPIFFSLNDTSKPDKVTASLFKSIYIPEYLTARKYFLQQTIVDAKIYKITTYGMFVEVVGNKVTAKLPVARPDSGLNKTMGIFKIGDTIKVKIAYLGHLKIIVEAI